MSRCPGGISSTICSIEFKNLQKPYMHVVLSKDRRTRGVTHAYPSYVGSVSDCAWWRTCRSLELAGYFRFDAIFLP